MEATRATRQRRRLHTAIAAVTVAAVMSVSAMASPAAACCTWGQVYDDYGGAYGESLHYGGGGTSANLAP